MSIAKRKLRIITIAVLTLVPHSLSLGQEGATVLRGNWLAAADARGAWHGRWTAQVLQRNPNVARGSWAVLGDSRQVVLEGTWSAQKQSAGWKGTWTAKTPQGRALSGSWQANASSQRGKTLEDILMSGMRGQVSGRWQSGPYHGQWQLTPPD
jgi:hypothetical protein